jgi:hypothetical protein
MNLSSSAINLSTRFTSALHRGAAISVAFTVESSQAARVQHSIAWFLAADFCSIGFM